MKGKGKIRMKDIAEIAGVSRISVSHILNPRPDSSVRVSEETRKKVLQIARELEYQPNLIARQLSGGKSGVIGFLMDSNSYSNWTDCMAQVEGCLSNAGYRIQVGLLHDNYRMLKNHLDDFYQRGVEGVICSAHTYLEFGEQVAELIERFPRRLFIQEPILRNRTSFVTHDIVGGIRILTEHLMRQGYRRPVLLAHKISDWSAYGMIRSYKEVLRKWQLPDDDSSVFLGTTTAPPDSLAGAVQVLDDVLSRKPDALIAGSDYVAMCLMNVLNSRGIRVPQDMVVVSNLHTNLGPVWNPKITGVDYHYNDIGRAAGEMMLEMLAQPENEIKIVEKYISAELIIGNSCGYQDIKHS